MINSLGFVADLFNFKDYESLASPWGEYTWFTGQDNFLSPRAEVSEVAINKTRFKVGQEPPNVDDLMPGVACSIVSVDHFASVISLDNLGQIGSDSGSTPTDIPTSKFAPCPLVKMSSVISEYFKLDPFVETDIRENDAECVSVSHVAIVSVISDYFEFKVDTGAKEPIAPGITVTTTGVSMVSILSEKG